MTRFKFEKAVFAAAGIALIAGCAGKSNLNYPATVDPGEPGIVDVAYTPIDEQNEADILLACADFAKTVTVRENDGVVNVEIESDKRISKAKFDEVAADVADYVRASRNRPLSVVVTCKIGLFRYKTEF